MNISDEMVEAVAKEFERHAWPDCPWDTIHESGRERYRQAARDALSAAQAIEAAERRKNCKHYSRVGNGSASSDGSGSYSWYCQACGASESYSHGATVVPSQESAPIENTGK